MDMGVLDEAERAAVDTKDFGLPGQRKYPIPDRSHAANAKSRAKQMLDAGRLSPRSYNKIVAKANAKLGKTDKDATEVS